MRGNQSSGHLVVVVVFFIMEKRTYAISTFFFQGLQCENHRNNQKCHKLSNDFRSPRNPQDLRISSLTWQSEAVNQILLVIEVPSSCHSRKSWIQSLSGCAQCQVLVQVSGPKNVLQNNMTMAQNEGAKGGVRF